MITKKNDNDEFFSPYIFSLETKPLKAIDSLFLALLPVAEKRMIHRGDSFLLGEDSTNAGILLLDKGLLTHCQMPSDTFMQTFSPPSLMGVIDGYKNFYDVPSSYRNYFYAETDVTIFYVPLEVFVRIMDKENLWHDISRLLAHRLLALSLKFQINTQSDAYEIIRTLIIELWNYPEEYRRQIKLPHFIQRRSGVSRSRIMKILMDLKTGGYIETEHGKLTSLHKLPMSY